MQISGQHLRQGLRMGGCSLEPHADRLVCMPGDLFGIWTGGHAGQLLTLLPVHAPPHTLLLYHPLRESLPQFHMLTLIRH